MQQYRPSGFNMLPPVIKNLLIINILFYLATIGLNSAFGFNMVKYLGLHYPASSDFGVWQIVSYMFMHSPTSITHVLFNMFALWMFGNTLENVWGSKRFLNYYLITGIGAGMVQIFVAWLRVKSAEVGMDPQQIAMVLQEGADVLSRGMNYQDEAMRNLNAIINTPTVGASGAVFGILLAFGMMFPNSLIYVYFAFPIKAKYFVMIYGALELFSGISNNASDNVAHFAHLGGMLFGFLLIMFWKKKGMLYE
jgi:membrane associated rhomboid family serine protease